MGYREHAKNLGVSTTGINTRINKDCRISSVYRRYGNEFFEGWAWETILWKGDNIAEQYETYQNAEKVIDLHSRIHEEFLKEES